MARHFERQFTRVRCCVVFQKCSAAEPCIAWCCLPLTLAAVRLGLLWLRRFVVRMTARIGVVAPFQVKHKFFYNQFVKIVANEKIFDEHTRE